MINYIKEKLSKKYNDNTLCLQYALWMLEKITGKSNAEILTLDSKSNGLKLTQEQLNTLDLWISRQVDKNEPLQYILGSVPFCNLEIMVEPPILIPRPETEEICYYAIEVIKNKISQIDSSLKILDIGTGSGCIALTIAKNFPECTVYACDISKKALELAKKNAQLNDITNVIFIQSDIYSGFTKNINQENIKINKKLENINPEDFNPDNIDQENIKFDLIISNPPYISETEYLDLDESVSNWEDKLALTANNNGLEIIEKIIRDAHKFLNNNPEKTTEMCSLDPVLIIEIGYKQGIQVKDIFTNTGVYNAKIEKDLENKDRFVVGYKL